MSAAVTPLVGTLAGQRPADRFVIAGGVGSGVWRLDGWGQSVLPGTVPSDEFDRAQAAPPPSGSRETILCHNLC